MDGDEPITLYQKLLELFRKPGRPRWVRADQGLVSKQVNKDGDFIRDALRRALRYEFEDDAFEACRTFAATQIPATASGVQWVRPLAPVTWIEFNYENSEPLKPGRFAKHGALIISTENNGELNMTAYYLHVHEDKLALPLAWTVIAPTREDPAERIVVTYYEYPFERMKDDEYKNFLKKMLEEWKNIINEMSHYIAAMLILLCHRKLYAARLVESRPSMAGAGSGKYLTHTVISIKLPRVKAVGSLVRFSNRDPVTPRRHSVEGHWCHSRRYDLGCSHEWQLEKDDHLYRCAHCGSAKWWRKAHERGDAEKGWVDQVRRVSTHTARAASARA